MVSKKEQGYRNQYNKKKYDRLTILLPKGKMEFYRDRANEAGVNLSTYIKDALQSKFDD